ncbi:MAG: hypothetical protein A2Z83_08110 [Omnitrophica bacterium GWA2_52_8]|nr:MAG: hypothetical protein A2Z83_08110 [Omnitrophica bacterium GWA2_52_8]
MTFFKGKALVTGGAGLIGSHLTDLLIERGYQVKILDNLEPQTHPQGKPAWVPKEAEFIQGDVRCRQDMEKALDGVRFVFHQAAFGGFTPEFSKYFDVNVGGTARLFEVLGTGKYAVEKIVVASSLAVYAEGAYHCGCRENLVFPPVRALEPLKRKIWEPLCPHCQAELTPALTDECKPREAETPYALSKEFEERMSLSAGKQLNIPVVALRYGVTYGPRQSLFNPYTGVASIFSTRILNQLSPLLYEDGEQTRDFVYVKDVAEANLFVMENPSAANVVFNVATGRPTSISDFAEELIRLYGKTVKPEISGQFRWGDVRHIVLNTEKLAKLGFKARTPLREGLGHFAAWITAQGPVQEFFSKAYDHLKQNRLIYG